jgi:hypothetical protein
MESVLSERAENLIHRQAFEGFVRPDYDGFNLKNVLPQIASVFGIAAPRCSTLPNGCLPESRGIKRVVLVIFDGLSYNRLLTHISRHKGAFAESTEKGRLTPITTVFPSTTATALTSLFSGLSPAQHQIIGYHMFSKKYGLIHNTLDMKPIYGYSSRVDLAKEYTQRIPLLAPVFESRGISVQIITKGNIIGSGLSQITHRDLNPIPYILGSDMWVHTVKALTETEHCLSIVYYSGVDSLAHQYGAYSPEVSFELASIDHNLELFIDSLSQRVKEETLLVCVADHGIADANEAVYLNDCPQIVQHLLLPPVGDGRASYLFCKPSHEDSFRAAFEDAVSGFRLFSSDDLVKLGVFGEPINREELKEKVGSFTVLSSSRRILDYPFFEEDRQRLSRGAHGGMTAEEMVIPLLSVRLSDL